MRAGIDYIGVGVGAVITNRNREVLLLLRKKPPEAGFWTIPGGRVEFGERLEDAILREVYEELGIRCRVVRLLRVTNHILPTEGVHWVSPAFLLVHVEGEPKNREPESHSDIRWFPVLDIPEKSTLTTRLAITSLLTDKDEIA